MLVHDASDRLRCADYLVGCAEQHALAEMRYVSKIQREHMRVYHVTLAPVQRESCHCIQQRA